jgi:hypothetical protein
MSEMGQEKKRRREPKREEKRGEERISIAVWQSYS